MRASIVSALIVFIMISSVPAVRSQALTASNSSQPISSAPHLTTSSYTSTSIQTGVPTSVSATKKPSFYLRRGALIGSGLVVGGGLLMWHDYDFRQLRNETIPTFRYHYDDYLQYSPVAIMLGLKAFGLESRSSWGRMLTADAFSVATAAIIVNSIKYTKIRYRPDGSNKKTFPSGHTATAFLCAALLNKEYGLTVSPWIGIGGYALATITAVSRTLNNKHWVSDLLAGAGIGILSVELGYYITELIFKDRGLLRPSREFLPVSIAEKPSFISFAAGYNLLPYDKPEHLTLAKSSARASVEGAWFINKSIGIGGQLSAGGSANIIKNSHIPVYLPANLSFIDSKAVNDISMQAGVYLSYALTNRLMLGGKLLGGIAVKQYNTQSAAIDYVTSIVINNLSKPSFTATSGISLMFVADSNFGIKLFADISYLTHDYQITTTEYELPMNSTNHTLHTFPITIGLSFCTLLP